MKLITICFDQCSHHLVLKLLGEVIALFSYCLLSPLYARAR
jgi:hypothetical protein